MRDYICPAYDPEECEDCINCYWCGYLEDIKDPAYNPDDDRRAQH